MVFSLQTGNKARKTKTWALGGFPGGQCLGIHLVRQGTLIQSGPGRFHMPSTAKPVCTTETAL